jgi:DNA-binding PadR family transcriptional regulator
LKPLTDLEAAVLAKIGREGRVTSYGIAKEFSESMSEFWSGSAGAIYPATHRLVQRGLIRATTPEDDGHTRTEYQLTAEGRREVKRWLLDVERAAGLGFDPLRSRLVNLSLVTETERRKFLEAVELRVAEALQSELKTDNLNLRRIHDSVMQARLGWIRAVRAILD